MSEWQTDKRPLWERAMEARRRVAAYEKPPSGGYHGRLRVGFETIPRDRLKDISRSGGLRSVVLGCIAPVHHEEAREAGRKGGLARHANRVVAKNKES